jgi:hypothetical protein
MTSRKNYEPKPEYGAVSCRIAASFLVIGLFVASQGCGSSKGLIHLTGRVSLPDGSPLVGARLIFRSNGSGDFSATTDENGNYSAGSTSGTKGIAPGDYVVTLVEYRDPDHPKPMRINAKYTQVKTSGLQVTVPAKSNTFDIMLDPPVEKKESG